MRRWGIIVAFMAHLNPTAWAGGVERFAIIVGNNEGHRPSRNLNYAEEDAKKVARVLSQLGGFSPRNTLVLTGATAQRVWQRITELEQRLKRLKNTAGSRSLLLFYYSGHARGDGLELGKSTLKFAKLVKYLRRSSATVRLAFIDSCQSGKLLRAKGGRPGPGYRLQVDNEMQSSGYAVITSSSSSELSQEAAEIRGSVFTHYLVSSLRGAGDRSGDGKVTLSEAYRYVYARTVAKTSVTVGAIQHPMYDFRLAGRGRIVLTRLKRARSLLRVLSPGTGRILVLDHQGHSIVAESATRRNEPVTIALVPGPYLVYSLADGVVQRAHAQLQRDRITTLSAEAFHVHKPLRGVSKGGLFVPEISHQIGAGLVVRAMPLAGGLVAYGAQAHYRMVLPSGWQPTLRVLWTTAPDAGLSTGYLSVGAHGGLGWVWRATSYGLRAEALMGYEHLAQYARGSQTRHTSALFYGAQLGVEIPWARLLWGFDGGFGGRSFQLLQRGWVHRFDWLLTLHIGWLFGTR